MYKLVAIDLDGTLLNPDKRISNYNRKVINTLSDMGIKVVIATGRTFTAANHYYIDLGLGTPVISCNGGFIYDPINEEVLLGKAIDPESLNEIIDFYDDLGAYYQYYGAKAIYTKKIAYLTAEWSEKNKELPEEAKINIEVVKNPKIEIEKRKEDIYKVLITDENKEVINEVWEKFSSNKKLELVVSVGNSLDIMASGITKGNAVSFLGEYYDIPMDQIIAIGDNHNDISMIKMAGCGIVMANSEELVKEHGDKIALSNSENGVGVILNEIFQLNLEVE